PGTAIVMRASATLIRGRAAVAQLAEQLFCKQQVTGSIPVGGSRSAPDRLELRGLRDVTANWGAGTTPGQDVVERQAKLEAGRGTPIRLVLWLSIAASLAIGASPVAATAHQPVNGAAATLTISAPPGSQFQSDSAHTGVQSASGIAPPLGVRWRVTIPQHPSYAIVGGGHVYVTYNLDPTHEALLALNESDGSTF